MTETPLRIATDERLGAYHFGPAHPFGPGRMPAFLEALASLEIDYAALPLAEADAATLTRFHNRAYVEREHRGATPRSRWTSRATARR